MKSLLMAAPLLAGLATSALAEEVPATTPPPSQAQAALAPSQDAPAPSDLPKAEAAKVVPMSAPLESNAAPPPQGGGCLHAKTTVYLTN
jgi:hypothetical protein